MGDLVGMMNKLSQIVFEFAFQMFCPSCSAVLEGKSTATSNSIFLVAMLAVISLMFFFAWEDVKKRKNHPTLLDVFQNEIVYQPLEISLSLLIPMIMFVELMERGILPEKGTLPLITFFIWMGLGITCVPILLKRTLKMPCQETPALPECDSDERFNGK